MKLQEIYKNQLINNLKLFNVVLGLSTIGNPSIKEFLELSKKSYDSICRNKDNKRKAISTVMELSSDIMVLSEDCSFYNIQLLDLSIYDRIDYLLDKVLKYSSSDKLTEFFNEDFLLTVGYLEIMENHLGDNVKQTLSYIVIRNFLVLCNLRLYRFAYYYAMFIKGQIFLSEGLNPRVEYSDLYKSELSLAIKKERNKFSKNIKKKITKNVKDAVNLVPGVNLDEKKDSKFVGDSTVMPVSGSNMSVDSISDLSNKTVEEYRDKIYDNSLSDKAGELKKNVSEASSKAIQTGKENVKAVGKSAYEGSKEFVKEHLEVPKPVIETIDKVKEGLGGESKAVTKSLEDLDRSIGNTDPIESSNAFGGSDVTQPNVTQPSLNPSSADKPKKRSTLDNLRKRRNNRNNGVNNGANNGATTSAVNSPVNSPVSNTAPNYANPNIGNRVNPSQVNGAYPNGAYTSQANGVNTNRMNPSQYSGVNTNRMNPSQATRMNPSKANIPNPSFSNHNVFNGMNPNGMNPNGMNPSQYTGVNPNRVNPNRVDPSQASIPNYNGRNNGVVNESHAFSRNREQEPVTPVTPVTPVSPIQRRETVTPIQRGETVKPVAPVTPVPPVPPVQKQQPSTSSVWSEPVKKQETVKKQEPVKKQETVKKQEPVIPVQVEKPVHEEKPVKVEKPVHDEKPVREEKPVQVEKPVHEEKPVYKEVTRRTYNGLSPKGVMRKMARPRVEKVKTKVVEEVDVEPVAKKEQPVVKKEQPVSNKEVDNVNPSQSTMNNGKPMVSTPSSKAGTKVKAKIRRERVVTNSDVIQKDSKVGVENDANSEDSYVDSSDIKKSSFFS